ncbi:hypothetical protein GCM10027181_19950 [Rheinheimera gaetbuli]
MPPVDKEYKLNTKQANRQGANTLCSDKILKAGHDSGYDNKSIQDEVNTDGLSQHAISPD